MVASSPPEELRRTGEALQAAGLDAVVLSSPANVTYVCGFEAPLPVGPLWEVVSHLPLLLAVVNADGAGAIVAADGLAPVAAGSALGASVHAYESLGHFEPTDPPTSFTRALETALRDAGLGGTGATVGIEPSLPALGRRLLDDRFGALRVTDAVPALETARRVKTPREVALLRRAADVASAAQRRLAELAAADGSYGADVDVWAELLRTMEVEAARHLTVTGELVTGDRTATIAPGGPVGRPVGRGDLALLDISPRLDGYWADCANTVVFGAAPTPDQRRFMVAARDACEAAIAALRPGARCSDAAEAVRTTLRSYDLPVAHYSGHGIGTSVNEQPRIVPYDHTVVEPGMVLCLEPGAYAGTAGSAGARAEKTVLITDEGPELLSDFEWGC